MALLTVATIIFPIAGVIIGALNLEGSNRPQAMFLIKVAIAVVCVGIVIAIAYFIWVHQQFAAIEADIEEATREAEEALRRFLRQ